MKMKKWMAVMAIMLLVLMLAACGGKDGQNPSGNQGQQGETGQGGNAAGNVKEFTIKATNFAFDVKEIKVNQGDTVKITLVNEQGNHALKINGYDQEVKGDETITFVADKKGEFNYFCSIFCGPGHGDMVGKLIVQ